MAKPNGISKDVLIQCAKDCLVNNGIERFTLRAVAERAGVTQGTIYYHFKTKEQLLIEIVQNICETSWQEISRNSDYKIEQAIESAKSRCSYDSFFHKLFFSLVTSSFNNEKIRNQLGEILKLENESLTKNLTKILGKSPIEGISLDTWGIILNAIVDGIALQALLQKDFPIEKTFEEFKLLVNSLNTIASNK